jgi:hypothetical protein
MKNLVFGLALLPFVAGIASAAEPLTEAEMDLVTAGAFTIPCFAGAVCSTSSGGTVLFPPGFDFQVIVAAYITRITVKGFPQVP